jgi:hypothetical protein
MQAQVASMAARAPRYASWMIVLMVILIRGCGIYGDVVRVNIFWG